MLASKIASEYEVHNKDRVCQGDILRDVSFDVVESGGSVVEYCFAYMLVLSQDCDLEHGSKFFDSSPDEKGIVSFNQFLPSIKVYPGFTEAEFRKGEHLKDVFKIKTTNCNSDQWKKIKQNLDPRFHYLSRCPEKQIPELVIDFKVYFTINMAYFLTFYKEAYLATINELFRESVLQRCCFYSSRIGLPEIKSEELT